MQALANPSDPLPLRWTAELMKRLRALYGTKFDQAWSNLDPKEIPTLWAEALAGFTGEEIAAGLTACRDREWPPTIPEFRRLARPWTDPEVAFYLAVKGMSERRIGRLGAWPHPAVYWAAVNVGVHELANTGYKAMQSRWEAALAAQIGRNEWEPIPQPSQALPAPGQTIATREEAEAALKRMNDASRVIKRTGDGRDWARKILATPQGRSVTAINAAKAALKPQHMTELNSAEERRLAQESSLHQISTHH